MSPSSACDATAPRPQMNGSDDPAPSGGRQEVETGAACSGLGAGPRSERLQDTGPGGGGDNGVGDVAMATEALPSTATSAGHERNVPLYTQQKTEDDPLLFQGSRARTDTAVQDGSSGDGSAERRGPLPGLTEVLATGSQEAQSVFQTPRARPMRPPAFTEAIRPAQQSNLPGWLTKLGEFFKAPAVTWMPSPIPSPPVPRRATQEDVPGRQRTPTRPTASGGARRDGLTVRGLGGNPNNSTPSSSDLPTEAIQAEVQRQLGGLIDRLQYMEIENAKLQEQLAKATAAPSGEAHPEPRGELRPGDVPRQDPDPWRGPLGALWNEWTGKGNLEASDIREDVRSRNPAPMLGESDPQPADSTGAMLEILARSMSQLQDMQARTLQKGLDDEAPEAVKSQVPALPALAAPEGVATGIVLQDWLAQIAIAMQDLSPSSGAWWSKVMDVVHNTYTRWLGSTPLERLQLQPQQYGVLAEGKWMRVNARACSMLLQSFTEVVKQDMISRRIVQHATRILFHLHTMYQPGGASEKTLVLGSLQTPSTCTSLDEALVWLRAWPRWIQRCQDLHMMCPDGTVLSRALTTVTSKFIAEGADAQFRTQLLRSTLRIDGQPSLDDVKRYHQHLQAELESAAAARTSTTMQQPKIQAAGVQGQGDKQQYSNTSTTTTKAPCKYFFKPSGCRRGQKCPCGHDLGTLPKSERSKKCLQCGAEDHRQRDCPTKTAKTAPKSAPSPTSASQGSPTMSSTGPRVQRMEPEGETSPTNASTAGVVTGEPVWTIESLLEAATKMTAAKAAAAQGPSINVISLKGYSPMIGNPQTYALVDSGATHALRRAKSQEEWEESNPVVVNLAGGGSVALRINSAGTILVPMSASTNSTSSAPIVPLGACSSWVIR